jgi:Asp-tRNA(Asn)/Glu-tRNA(Gln) amidotransferase A subunit family amidase
MPASDEDGAPGFTPVHELAHTIRAKYLPPLELMQAVLRKIDSCSNTLHAFFTICTEVHYRGSGEDMGNP